MSFLFGLFLGKTDKQVLEMKKDREDRLNAISDKESSEAKRLQRELDEINKFIEEKGIKEE